MAAPAPSLTTPTTAPAPSLEAPPAQTAGTDKTCGMSNFQQDLLNRINQARAIGRMCGTTFYKAAEAINWNARLFDAAAAHAGDMAANNYFSHVSLDGRTFSQRISAASYTWSAVGENIAAGQSTPEQVMAGWLDSPGHCQNIMNPSYTEVAVSCVRNEESLYKRYWAMELGRPK
jgi:uncharacterized protein YkwD